MTHPSSNSIDNTGASLIERMRRAQRADAPDDPAAPDPPPQTPAAPDTPLVDEPLLQRARDIAAQLIAGELSADRARQQILHACLIADDDTPRNPELRDEVVTLLNNNLQFRAEVDNMLVLAARELEGGPD